MISALEQNEPNEAKDLRFEFGQNWVRFRRFLSEERLHQAKRSLLEMLNKSSLSGESFLDIGCGSGLFSLAARELGGSVVSFDYDPQSVRCTQSLKDEYYPKDAEWRITRGSILDSEFVGSLHRFSVVYSWGVLHHTGKMWAALENATHLVKPGGLLWIAIYNDQGRASVVWHRIKKAYNRLPPKLRWTITLPVFIRFWLPPLIRDLFILRPFQSWRTYVKQRGMSPWHDIVDWVGGYPFEVAKPEQVIEYCAQKGFRLATLRTCAGRNGCNEFVFINEPSFRSIPQ